MSSEKTRTAIIVSVLALVALLVVGGLAFVTLKFRAQAARRQALAELKAANPVEYYILHTANTKSDEDLKSEMVGKWELRGVMNRQTGQFFFVPAQSGNFKMWTLTNWSIATYDLFSNLQYKASGHYTLERGIYTESIEAATGQMTRFLGAHPKYKIRVDGDAYYQMSANPPRNGNAFRRCGSVSSDDVREWTRSPLAVVIST